MPNLLFKKKKIPGQFQEQFFLMDLNNCTSDVSESLYDHFRGALSYSYDLLKYDTNYKVMMPKHLKNRILTRPK